MRLFLFLVSFVFAFSTFSQKDSLKAVNKLKFSGDFRFRIEQDWKSRKSDGSYRDDRSRLRYRMRFGANYAYNEWITFGMRIRTGQWNKQQDAHVTLGTGFKEFSTAPLGFDKIFLEFKRYNFNFWLGKNSYPFKKQNELFWSDNVSPDGVFLAYDFKLNSKIIDQLKINAGHFIVKANSGSFNTDAYFQGVQLQTSFWKKRVQLFPGFYYFNKMPDIPDGLATTTLNYAIFHVGGSYLISKSASFALEADFYANSSDLTNNPQIPTILNDQNKGYVFALKWGKLKEKNDFQIKITYALLERYSIVDYFAQNDWVRWDYSSIGSPDGRLANFQGAELSIAYAINKNFKLKTRCFMVEQLISTGAFKENGYRVRLDLDIGF